MDQDESEIVVDEEIIDRPFHGGGAVLVFVNGDDGENAAANTGVGRKLGSHYGVMIINGRSNGGRLILINWIARHQPMMTSTAAPATDAATQPFLSSSLLTEKTDE